MPRHNLRLSGRYMRQATSDALMARYYAQRASAAAAMADYYDGASATPECDNRQGKFQEKCFEMNCWPKGDQSYDPDLVGKLKNPYCYALAEVQQKEERKRHPNKPLQPPVMPKYMELENTARVARASPPPPTMPAKKAAPPAVAPKPAKNPAPPPVAPKPAKEPAVAPKPANKPAPPSSHGQCPGRCLASISTPEDRLKVFVDWHTSATGAKEEMLYRHGLKPFVTKEKDIEEHLNWPAVQKYYYDGCHDPLGAFCNSLPTEKQQPCFAAPDWESKFAAGNPVRLNP